MASQFARSCLTWWPQLGVGYYPILTDVEIYDRDYFDRFDRAAHTELGKALMRARVDFVERYYRGVLCDVGIGSGAFVELRSSCGQPTRGYDINPAGIEWLKRRNLLADPYATVFNAVSLWDVLEHMPDFQSLINNVGCWIFTSLPIFCSADHVLSSKHYRPNEHCWYFTRNGLVKIMQICGFELVSENNMETELGREDIGTFAFRRMFDAT